MKTILVAFALAVLAVCAVYLVSTNRWWPVLALFAVILIGVFLSLLP